MKEVRSVLAPGHIVVRVKDLPASVEFYERMGLPAFGGGQSIALIELRGGTHILLTAEGSPGNDHMVSSRYGQIGSDAGESFDLMIEGRDRSDLEAYRNALIDNGIEPGEIGDAPYFGHYLFTVDDLDGNTITVYTSHEIKYLAGSPEQIAIATPATVKLKTRV